ncbi:AsmA-like C-terminal region-containing protein [Rhodopila sp.]|uniref:YhdP family protein n=1 Tax=Rhodopila sp. TaxID=2480087 RepID=UPI003D1451E5
MIIAMGLLLAASLLLAGIAFRLSTGPINASSLFRGAPFTVSVGPGTLSFDGFTLAWEGFHRGVGFPVDLRLVNIAVNDAAGRHRVVARQALLSLSLSGLLRGQLVPRDVELDDGLVTITRDHEGAFNLALTPGTERGADTDQIDRSPDLRSILGGFARGSDGLGRLRRVRLDNFGVTVHDEQRGLNWQASGAELDFQRQATGAIVGSAHVPFVLANQHVDLAVTVALPFHANGQIEASLSPIQPPAIGQIVPSLGFLAALEAPASIKATLALDPGFMPLSGHAEVKLDAGRIDMGEGSLPIRGGSVVLSGSMDRVMIEDARLSLPSSKAGPSADVRFSGEIRRQAERLTIAVALTLDHLDLADLARNWPIGVGGGARLWIVQNVTTGTISHAAVSLVMEAGKNFNHVVLTKATGDLDGDDVSIAWLEPLPPIEQAQVHLHLIDPDRMVISMPSGHQRISKGGADLLIQDGQMLITGLAGRDQVTRISLRVNGPVASAITLLKEPRLHLLSEQPFDLKDPSGDTSATVSLDFPLDENLRADEIVFHVGAHLHRLHLADVVAGRDLSDGQFDLLADKAGLSANGQGSLAMVPITATGTMDFSAGPPTQVLQRISISGRPDAGQLADAGIDVKRVLVSGQVPLTATLLERRNGDGSIALNANLAAAVLQVKPVGWSKAAGTPSKASATILLSHDRLVSIVHIVAVSTDALVAASVECPDGVLQSISINRANLGKTDMHGAIRIPANQPINVSLSGAQIDLSSPLESLSDHAGSVAAEVPDWTLDARFDRVLLANGETAVPLSVRASSSGGLLHYLDLNGSLSPASVFFVRINMAGGERHLAVAAADAGAFLAGTGLTPTVRSGRLTVNGDFNDRVPDHPFDGIARIEDARLVNVPILGKVLQAVTLYGLADLLRGPGIGISRMIVPLGYQQNHLRISDGRIFSPSLGLTVRGMIDLSTNRLALNGTIVPVYAINSMLGHIPLIGKLFSPEVGGGVFAARYKVDGPFGDTTVSVNPLSILTPGFLRDLFDTGRRAQ